MVGRRLIAVASALLLAVAASACSDSSDGVTAGTAANSAGSAPGTTSGEPSVPATTESAGPDPAVTATPDTTGPSGLASLDWGACVDVADSAGTIDCATLEVPLDYQQPDGDQIEIAVARIDSASGDDQIGSLVFNPGGPGGSGIDFLTQAAFTVPADVQERFDLVAFDPRGVGRSSAVACDIEIDDNVSLLEAGDDAGWADLVAEAEALMGTCDPASQDLFGWVGTNNAARDLDRLREALGDDLLSYVGYSYGTRLGATYAELFPDRIRALVLDGAVKPTVDSVGTDIEQAGGFDQALEAFAAACDADEDCILRELGPTIEVIDGLEAEIAEVGSFPTDDEGRVLTPGELSLAIAAALYSEDAWPFLAQALYVAEVSQDGSILQALSDSYTGRRYDGTYDNSIVANTAINCADDPARPSVDEQRSIADETAAASTYFGGFLRATTGCIGIEPARDPLILGPAAGAPPILVIGTTGDPATPYQWAVELADFLESGVLYTVEGEGHTAYGSIECVADAVNAYLIDLEVPSADEASCADDADTDVFLPAGESELEQVVAFLDCLRENGLDIPEIGVDELIADPLGESFGDAIDPTDPEFNDAAIACQALIPG